MNKTFLKAFTLYITILLFSLAQNSFAQSCPLPIATVTQNPTCLNPFGQIKVTGPTAAPLPTPSNLFISEVTDESTGSLTYVEIYNGTGAAKNLANYKIKIYNNGGNTTSCDFPLVGILANNSNFILAVGSVVNMGGVIPNQVAVACGGVNNNDNIRLTTIGDAEIDLWGDTTGAIFTPAPSGYTYRRNITAPHPSIVWNPADWTAIAPQDYTNVGTYNYVSDVYEFSLDGGPYQSGPLPITFTGVAPGNHTVTLQNVTAGCFSTPLNLVVPNVPTIAAPTVSNISNVCPSPTANLATAVSSAAMTTFVYRTFPAGVVVPNPNAVTAGNYTVENFNPTTGCSSARSQIVVTINSCSGCAIPPTLSLNGASAIYCQLSTNIITGNTFGGSATNVTITENGAGSINGATTVTTSPFDISYSPAPGDFGNQVTITVTTNNPLGGACTPVVKTFVMNFAIANLVTTPQAICASSTTDITLPAVTAGSTNIGPLQYYSDAAVTVPLANPNAVTAGTYYIKTTNAAGCSAVKPVVVSNGGTPTASPFIFFDAASPFSTPTSANFDFNNAGQTSFYYSYTINDQLPAITGTWVAPTNFTVNGLLPSDCVTFTLTWVGLCTNPLTAYRASTPTFAAIAPICQNSTAPALPSISTNGISGTWNPAVINTSAVGTTSYVFTPNLSCANPATLNVTIIPATVPTFTNIPTTLCQNSVAPILPNTSTNGVTGTWSGQISTATLGTFTYTFTPTASQCASAPFPINVIIAPNVTPTFASLNSFCANTTPPVLPTTSSNGITGTWSPAIVSNTASGSYTFTPTAGLCATSVVKAIIVNPTILSGFQPTMQFCFGAVAPALATTSPNGITGTWSPATINVTASGNYIFTPTAGQCSPVFTLAVTITPNVNPIFTISATACAGETPQILPNTSSNGVTGTWSPSVVSTVAGIYNYVFTPNAGQCTFQSSYPYSIEVKAKSATNFAPVGPFCKDATIPALPTSDLNGYIGSWSPAINNQVTTVYTFTPLPNQCALPFTNFTIVINQPISPTFLAVDDLCAGDIAPTLPLTSLENITGTWSPATINNLQSSNYIFTPDPGQCAKKFTLGVIVNQKTIPNFPDIAFCEGTTPPILPNTSPNGVEGSWEPAIIDNMLSGTYQFTPNPTLTQCAEGATITVTVNQDLLTLFPPTVQVSNYFNNQSTATVITAPNGNFQYQLDFGPIVASNIFTNLSGGSHFVTVLDVNGCGEAVRVNFSVIDYPNFFTPNGDGYNDRWNIFNLKDQLSSKISIFDRYGKLLKQIAPAGLGWDGKFNDKEMPSTDYWFTVEYSEFGVRKEFKAHFSLKR